MSRHAAKALSAALPTALIATLLLAAAPAQAAPAGVVVTDLAVTVATANGSGCPDTTTAVRVQPDGSSFTIDFSGYVALAGGGAPPTAFRRNCQFSLQITRPEGLTYAVEGADYSGFALLQAGVTGVQAARYYFQGDATTTVVSHEFAGPLADDWQTTDTFGPGSLRFAQCGFDRNLNVNTDLRLRRSVPTSTVTDLMVMNPSITLRLTWQACP